MLLEIQRLDTMEDSAPSITSIHNHIDHATADQQQQQQQQASSSDLRADHAGASAQLEWDMQAAAGLAPNNVQIAKVQRAFDRKPTSPFSRRRFKVGKIMKRTGPGSTNAAPAGMFNVHIRDSAMKTAAGGSTPVKAVKKMRLENDTMDRAMSIVSNWDGRESPKNRRIATRSSLGQEALIALAEDDENQEGEMDELDVTGLVAENEGEVEGRNDPVGTTIEFFDESGAKLDTSVDDDEWADASVGSSDVDGESTAASTHLELPAAIEGQIQIGAEDDFDDTATEVDDPEDNARGWDRLRGELQDVRRAEAKSFGIPFDEYMKRFSPSSYTTEGSDSQEGRHQRPSPTCPAAENATAQLSEVLSNTSAALPDGFVSPVINRRRPISQVKMQNAGRRKTLPKDFAAQYAAARASEKARAAANGNKSQENESQDSLDEATTPYTPEQTHIQQQRLMSREDPMDSIESVERRESSESHSAAGVVSSASASKLSSPIPSISGSHPRLPLRRSPRRQSSSPFKGKSILKSTAKHHLIAFTPIKLRTLPVAQSPISPLPFVPSGITIEDSRPEQPVRSSSAPPEEHQITLRKHYHPRISDDTALLEAFVKRASESKKRNSLSNTARRESFERQSESAVVPQALADSPGERVASGSKDVLGDLDPNSPSPRKANSAANLMLHDERRNLQLEYAKDPIKDDLGEDELATESSIPQRFGASRKSGRMRKKPESLLAGTNSRPAKISIKRSGEGVVLKQTEAARLATETRKNTNSNKSGAVLPLVRLQALRAEEEARASQNCELGSDVMEIERPVGRHGISWSETLVSFYEGVEPEVSMMADELSINLLSAQGDASTELETGPAALSANDTPTPRLRRLKPSRTASTPGITPAKRTLPGALSLEKGEQELEVTADGAPKLSAKRSAKRKVSRIATPAKPKRAEMEDRDGTVTAADHETSQVTMPAISSRSSREEASRTVKNATAASKVKATASKLPAPATSNPMPEKENGLAASPPKKRMTKTSRHAAAAAPTKLNLSGDTTSLGRTPRFDIQRAAKSRPGDEGAMTGLISSPPKKVGSLRALPGREVARGLVLGAGVGVEDEDPHHHGEVSMRSPAKKGGKRAAAATN